MSVVISDDVIGVCKVVASVDKEVVDSPELAKVVEVLFAVSVELKFDGAVIGVVNIFTEVSFTNI